LFGRARREQRHAQDVLGSATLENDMTDFSNAKQSNSLSAKLWRGERMCLVGMDVNSPEDDFVGFSIEVNSPGSADFMPLRNRIAFSYDKPADQSVDGYRNFSSLVAPFQKFRWVHFPYEPKAGTYIYRVTKQHMPSDGKLRAGDAVTLDIPLDQVAYDGFLDVGFARNYASSQAYNERYGGNPNVIPVNADQGLKFHKVPGDVYEWLGFEAYDLIMGILNEVAADKTLSLDFFAYDLNEPDIIALLEKMGSRLRAIIDNSGDHGPATSAESQSAKRLAVSAGGANVKRMHFSNLQHNKVLIVKKNGEPQKVLFGSTNFSFRGIYIQANNALVSMHPQPRSFSTGCSSRRSPTTTRSTRNDLLQIRLQQSGISSTYRANPERISASRPTPIPVSRSIRSGRRSIRPPHRYFFRSLSSIRPSPDRRAKLSIV
jgi:hypothetical protein